MSSPAPSSQSSVLSLVPVKTAAGSLDPAFLRQLATLFPSTTFIETGTFLGNTAAAASEAFSRVHTIELSADLARQAKERFATNPRVTVHEGDSASTLAAVLRYLEGRAVLWLDGHYSEGVTAHGGTNTPILSELGAIAESGRSDLVILIDDIRLFDTRAPRDGAPPSVTGYPSLNTVHRAISQIGGDYAFYVIGDVAIAFPGASNCQVSPLVQAMTVSRLYDGTNLPVEDVIAAESVIAAAAMPERSMLESLVGAAKTCEAYGYGLHYRLWFAATLAGQGKLRPACEEYLTLCRLEFGHWRSWWYLAAALYAAGDARSAAEVLNEVRAQAPDFGPAISLEKMLGAAAQLNATPKPSSRDLDALRSRGLFRDGQPLRLHLGCGEQHFDGYVNIDYPSDQHNVMTVRPDYEANITQLHFPPGSVDEIRLHHVFEHFNRVTALAMLIKWQEWLKPGGRLHIETPDLMGSAETLVSDAPWDVKMASVRHLAGDQAAAWAYHVDHWFPERYRRTLQALGFDQVEAKPQRWPHSPFISNVHALATKTRAFSREELLAKADALLWESTVAPAERPTYEVWRRQLRAVLDGGSCGPANLHTPDMPAAVARAPQADPVAAPAPISPAALLARALAEAARSDAPLAEIHDFNQRSRDRWVAAKARTIPAGARVLDMGAGTCLYRPLFAHCEYRTHDFKQYTGSEKHLGTSAYGHIDYVSEILAIPVPDRSFDVILCTEVLEHVPEPIKVLKEIARILRPGGRAFITAPLASGLHQLPFHFYGGYTPEWYKRFTQEAGLSAVEITPNGGFFKHLGQECARAASLLVKRPDLLGSEAATLLRLFHEDLPRMFFEIDSKHFDERFTVGYFVEAVSINQEDPGGKVAPASRAANPVEEVRVTQPGKTGRPVVPCGAGPRVRVKLMGGMGNQMFQYAAGLAVARRTGADLELDIGFLRSRNPRPDFTVRDFDLDLFECPADVRVLTAPGEDDAGRLQCYKEKHFHYDGALDTMGAEVYLDGYWQSPRYFAQVKDEIRRTFTRFRTPLTADAQRLADEIRSRDSVCLNVRRGDFVTNPSTNAFHGVCGEAYFQQAVRCIRARHPQAHFYIFTDDEAWCRTANLVDGAPCTLVGTQYAGDRFAGKLQLMMACRHFIIPNSSFGWWAAYLGSTEDSIVIAPNPWFADLSVDTSDLLPAHWTLLSRQPGPLPSLPDPVVSVVVPCYRQAHYLQEAVESVVAQTFGEWELLVVNDGSPDDTAAVARALIARHPGRRIRLVDKPNGGLADARNAGIAAATGRYILPLDADDRLHPQMLERTVAVLEADRSVVIAYTDLVHFGAVNKVVRAAEYDFQRLPAQNQLNACSLFRREAWVAVGGYNRNMIWGYEDWDFWVGCGERGYFGRHVPEALLYYRVKDASMYTKALEHHAELHALIVLNHPAIYGAATREEARQILTKAGIALPQPARSSDAGQPTVSIVVPCYRQAAYLTEAVASVIAQTYADWELLIVNDGSPDDTSAVAQQLIRMHPQHRLRLIEKANGGLADARNAGITLARGRYLLPLDADDKLHPRFLEKTVALLEAKPEVAIAYCDWQYFGADDRVRHAAEYDFERLCTKENLFTCTSLFRRAAWSAAGGYNRNMTHGVEDWDFWIGCGEKGFVGQRIPEVLFYYRAKPGSMIHTLQPHLKAMFARIVLNHPALYRPENVASAREVFEAAQLPAPKPAAPGTEWLPAADSKAETALGRAEIAIQAAAFMDAIRHLRDAFEQPLDRHQIERAQALVARIPQPGEQSAPPSTALTPEPVVADGDFFGADEVASIEALLSRHRADGADGAAELHELRRGLVQFLSRTEVGEIERLFSGDFGRVYRQLAQSDLVFDVPVEEQGDVVQQLADAASLDPRLLLTAILTVPAHRYAAPMQFEAVPSWCLDDVLHHLLNPPQGFSAPGEADQYLEHLAALAAAICPHIERKPRAPLTLKLALAFATRASCIPAYATDANTRDLMRQRARIIEFILTANGAALDARLPARSGGRIRVGFLSAHFTQQTETHVTLGALHLDREKFEVWLFPLRAADSPLEARCRSLADHFVPLPAEIADQVKTIRAAALDVLIIGTNVTAVTNGITLLAAHRLAPLQLASYCSPMSTGFRHVDGFISGTLSAFEGASAHFTEKLIVCDGPPGCLDYAVEPAATQTFDRGSLGLGQDEVVFVNAASCFKIPVELQETWASILARVPNSRLLLLPFNPNWASRFPAHRFMQTLQAALRRQKVAWERVVLVEPLSCRQDVLALERLADVYLDTFPFSGSLSVIDPLQMGVPTVVWPGRTPRSRAAAALLRELAVEELIAADEASYIDMAVRVASDSALRASLRDRLGRAMAQAPRFVNPEAYGRELGRKLEELVRPGKAPRTPVLECV